MRKQTLAILAVFLGLPFCLNAKVEKSKPSNSSPQRIDLLQAEIQKNVHHADVKRITFGPGQKAGVHFHPCPVVGFVVQGSIAFATVGNPIKVLKAGDAFFEPANQTVSHFDNASATEPAQIAAVYLVGAEDKSLVEMRSWEK